MGAIRSRQITYDVTIAVAAISVRRKATRTVWSVARSDAAKMGQEAPAYNIQVVDASVGDAARFSGLAQEYVKAPLETSTRLYLETIDDVLPKMNKTIVGADPKAVDLQFVGKK
jgi:regulator of protease activity HflC (stomatin/prohibitin superfamily)